MSKNSKIFKKEEEPEQQQVAQPTYPEHQNQPPQAGPQSNQQPQQQQGVQEPEEDEEEDLYQVEKEQGEAIIQRFSEVKKLLDAGEIAKGKKTFAKIASEFARLRFEKNPIVRSRINFVLRALNERILREEREKEAIIRQRMKYLAQKREPQQQVVQPVVKQPQVKQQQSDPQQLLIIQERMKFLDSLKPEQPQQPQQPQQQPQAQIFSQPVENDNGMKFKDFKDLFVPEGEIEDNDDDNDDEDGEMGYIDPVEFQMRMQRLRNARENERREKQNPSRLRRLFHNDGALREVPLPEPAQPQQQQPQEEELPPPEVQQAIILRQMQERERRAREERAQQQQQQQVYQQEQEEQDDQMMDREEYQQVQRLLGLREIQVDENGWQVFPDDGFYQPPPERNNEDDKTVASGVTEEEEEENGECNYLEYGNPEKKLQEPPEIPEIDSEGEIIVKGRRNNSLYVKMLTGAYYEEDCVFEMLGRKVERCKESYEPLDEEEEEVVDINKMEYPETESEEDDGDDDKNEDDESYSGFCLLEENKRRKNKK